MKIRGRDHREYSSTATLRSSKRRQLLCRVSRTPSYRETFQGNFGFIGADKPDIGGGVHFSVAHHWLAFSALFLRSSLKATLLPGPKSTTYEKGVRRDEMLLQTDLSFLILSLNAPLACTTGAIQIRNTTHEA